MVEESLVGDRTTGSTSTACQEPQVPPLCTASNPSSRHQHQQVEVSVPHPRGQWSTPTPLPWHRDPCGTFPFLPPADPIPRGRRSSGAANTQHWRSSLAESSSLAECGTWTSGSSCRYLLGEEVPGTDNELKDVLQGLEGAHEQLAGLPPARVIHVLCQHRDQLPAGWGRVWPGLSRLPGLG